MDGDELVGFAASGPDEDLEGAVELVSLLVLPRWGRRGHGSRLVAASVADWQQDGRTLAVCWAFERDAVDAGVPARRRLGARRRDPRARHRRAGADPAPVPRGRHRVTGFPEAALDFYEGLEADNSKAYWTDHKASTTRRSRPRCRRC